MKLIKLTPRMKSQICGTGFNWIAAWGLGLLTTVVFKSLAADKGGIGINGVGRASWEKQSLSTMNPHATPETKQLLKLLKNLYAF